MTENENVVTEDVTNEETKTEEIDFSSKDFEKTKELLNNTAKIDSLKKDMDDIRSQRKTVAQNSLKSEDDDDIIQKHIDKFATPEELENYLKGKVTDPEVKERINSFFTNDETGEVLELFSNENVKTEADELEFKRGLLNYFKQNDFYMEKIDEEVEGLNRVTEEFNQNISEALNPLKDNILAYSQYLLDRSEITEDDTDEQKRIKNINRKKAIAIKNGYTLENMTEIIEYYPNIVNNALKDFRNDTKVREIGKRYSDKLKTAKVSFNLFGLLNDDIHKSLEYKCLPKGDYPEGLENFTVFFIIRSLSMSGVSSMEDNIFHASVQIALSKLMNNTLDEDISNTLRAGIIKLLSYFDN